MDPLANSGSICQYPHLPVHTAAVSTSTTTEQAPAGPVHTSLTTAPTQSFAHTPPSYHSQWSTYSSRTLQSPPTSSNPLTPTDGVFPQQQHLDISDWVDTSLIDPSGLMTPKQQMYEYPEGTYHGEVSQERTTAAETPTWPQSLGTNMLPPLRPHEPTHSHSYAYETHYYPGYATHHTEPYAYPKHEVPTYGPAKSYGSGYSYYPQPGSGAAAPGSSLTDLVTPSSTEYPYTGQYGTIQPSAFGGWSENPRRDDGLLAAPSPRGDRKNSVSTGESRGTTGEWTRPSPAISRSSEEDELVAGEVMRSHVPGSVQYTSDSEIKQTKELKRMCYNCHAIQPPSWRKSLLYVGKILCNKCGIYERTHHRARPQQNDEHKLRRGSGGPPVVSRGSKLPRLQVMREDDDESPLGSPYSAVPSQSTPATFTFPPHVHPSPSYHMPPPNDFAPPNSALVHRRHSQAHIHEHGHGYTRRAYHSLTPGQTHTYPQANAYASHTYHPHGSHASHSHGAHGHGQGQSSPYAHAHAYARRTATYPLPMAYGPKVDPGPPGLDVGQPSSSLSGGVDAQGSGSGKGAGAGHSPVDVKPSVLGWNTRRHNDGTGPSIQVPRMLGQSTVNGAEDQEEQEQEGDDEEDEDEEDEDDDEVEEDDGGEYRPGRAGH